MKASEIRNLTKDELEQKYKSLRGELFNLKFQAKTGRLEKPHRIRQIKRDIARIKTIFRETEKNGD